MKQKGVRMRIGPIGEAVLATIALAGILTVAVCAPNAFQLLKPFFKKKKYSPKQAITRNIESLVRTGFVTKVVNTEGEITLQLTQRGRWESLLRTKQEKKPKQWDKRWRIVIFDVPNEKNDIRDQLTRGMRMYGFRLLQKSVWIYPYACDEFINVLRDHFEVKSNVVYLTVTTFEYDKKWSDEFKI